jgi:outer membrane protein
MKNNLIFALLLLLFHCKLSIVHSQLTLEQCIELGLKNNNLLATQLSNNERTALNYNFGKWSFLPTISTSSGYNISYGRKLDPFTNTFGVNSVYSNSYSVYSQATLFQGFRYFKQNKLNQLIQENTKVDFERNNERIKTQIVERCVTIWKLQLKQIQQQKIIEGLISFKQKQKELVKEGRIRGLDTLETSINIRTQQISFRNIEKDLRIETMNLNFYLGKKISENTELLPLHSMIEPLSSFLKINVDEYYQLEDLETKLEVSKQQYKVEITQWMPTLSLIGNLGSGYSTNNKDYSIPSTPIINYDNQIRNNLYQGIGFSLSLPIFNRGDLIKRVKTYNITKKEQEILVINKSIELEKKKLEVKNQLEFLQENIRIQKAICSDKETIFQISQTLYLEGKIRLVELEKIQTDLMNALQLANELEIESLKLSMFRFE